MTEEMKNEHLEEPADALPEVQLADLPEHLREAAARAGWTKLMPVQAKSLPYLLASKEVLVQSRTGSGKTGAFILPALDKIDPSRDTCQCLVLAPTRELAKQVAREAEILAGDSGLRVAAVYGGVGYHAQEKAFREGAHMVVGTPGRILDHLLKHNFNLDDLRMLIFDEADRMLSIGFYPDMKAVQRYLPKRHVPTFMFSATYPPQVKRLATEFMREERILSLSGEAVHVSATPHVFYKVPRMEKDRTLMRIIEMENPVSAMIFCNTKSHVHYLASVLKNFGYNAEELSADLNQNKRERILGQLRSGQLRFLVATDVAARGIDIPDLSHVFLYEPPEDPESYIHRAGRTGRAGAAGIVMSLVDTMEEVALQRIARLYSINLEERTQPTPEDVQNVAAERVTALLEAKLRSKNVLEQERMQRFRELAKSLGENEEELWLVAMLLDDHYQQSLHAPPVAPPAAERPRGGEKQRRRPRRRRRKPAPRNKGE